MSKKPCWSWRHRMKFQSMPSADYKLLDSACSNLFSDDRYRSRWDITHVRRLSISRNSYWYRRITVHFKRREDMVLFVLRYNIDNSSSSRIDWSERVKS